MIITDKHNSKVSLGIDNEIKSYGIRLDIIGDKVMVLDKHRITLLRDHLTRLLENEGKTNNKSAS